MNDLKYNLIAFEVASKSDNQYYRMDPILIALIAEVIMMIVKECFLDEDRVQAPSWWDKVRLKWLVRGVVPWKDRQYRDEVYNLLLKWGSESDRVVVGRTLYELRGY